MIILAIDPAARTGWALSDGDQLAYGVWPLGSHPSGRLARLEESLEATIERFRVETIAYENAAFGSHNRHIKSRHSELAGVIELVAARRRLKCWNYGPSQWKAIALTSGNLDKPGVMRALRIVYEIEVDDADVADALGILHAAMKGPPPESKKKATRRAAKKLAKEPRLF